MTRIDQDLPLRFVQIGDLHLTGSGLENHRDFLATIDEVNRHMGSDIDFVFLPGDNADDGTDDQFALVLDGLKGLRLPWHAIPGDHDYKPRSLDGFYRALRVRKLPYAEEIRGCVCLFLDVVSQGTGGPDFRLGPAQMSWLEDQLARSAREAKPSVVMMHAYPDDLGAEADSLSKLIDRSTTRLVAMGHTHYNELAHDGRTIYAATRSTGQIEEGPVGFSIAALDHGVVSWRFKPLDSGWPFAMITSPADRRLALDDGQADQIRASAWSAATLKSAQFRIDDGPWQPMTTSGTNQFAAPLVSPDPRYRLEVEVADSRGKAGRDCIEIAPIDDVVRTVSGSDRNTIGAWPERHLMGTQLGPNRNGRKW
jgi:predicted phosphodiesterase